MNYIVVDKKIVNRNRLIRRQRIFLIRRIIFIFLIFIIFILVLINSPLFSIKKLNITGNKILSTEYITEELSEIFHKNMFFHSIDQSLHNLKENKYINGITYTKNYPNTVNIVIEEKNIDYYIFYNNEYYLFDRNSELIDILDYKQEFEIIEIKGVDFSGGFNIGDRLFGDDSREVQWIRNISELLDLNNSDVNFDYIDLSDVHNVIMGYNNLQIKIGNNSDLRRKLNIAINVINSDERYRDASGYIDVRSTSYPVISLQ